MLTGILSLVQAVLAKKPGRDEEPRDVGLELREEKRYEFAPPGGAEPESVRLEIDKVGVWAGRASMDTSQSIARTIRACTFLGVRRLDIIVNDDAEESDPIPYKTYDKGEIVNLALAANKAKIDVHLMSWIMPHEKYIDGAAGTLRELYRLTGAKSIQFDAEEPWTQARKPMKYTDAAKRIADSFGGLPLGVNGIGYVDASKFGPLAEVCDYLVPQCYATSTSGLKPTTAVPKIVKRWQAHFGKKKFVIGLAAYNQPPPGYTVDSAMRAAFGSAEALEDVSEVIFWSLGAIRKSAAVTKTIRALASGA